MNNLKGSSTYWATWNSWYTDQYAHYLHVDGYDDDANMWELILDFADQQDKHPDDTQEVTWLKSKYLVEI